MTSLKEQNEQQIEEWTKKFKKAREEKLLTKELLVKLYCDLNKKILDVTDDYDGGPELTGVFPPQTEEAAMHYLQLLEPIENILKEDFDFIIPEKKEIIEMCNNNKKMSLNVLKKLRPQWDKIEALQI